MFSSDNWFGASPRFYNGVATQSLRFDDDSSAYLSRTPSSTSDTKTWVWSGWVKRGNAGLYQTLFMAGTSSSSNFRLVAEFTDSKFQIYYYNGGNKYILPSAVHRDHSAWYHVVFACDTTQTTDSNKLNIYINGEKLTALSTENQPTTDYSTQINSNILHTIGRRTYASDQFFDGYLAEVNFVDGLSFFSDTSGTPNTAFNINSFGETKNGVWIAKAYTGSYGTNGFRLAFDSGDLNLSVNPITDPYGSATDVPADGLADASGQGNHWVSSGIDAEDCGMPDSPENNFCTYNPLYSWATTNTTLSEGNLKSTETGTAFGAKGIGTIAVNSGKWYFETHPHLMGNANYANIGVIDVSEMTTTTGTGSDTGKFKAICYASYQGRKSAYGTGVDSSITLDGLGQSSYGDSWGATDIIGVALDIDNDAIYFSKNGTWQNSATSAEISAGTTTNSAYTGKLSGLTWTVAQGNGLNANNFGFTLNAGQDATFAGYLDGTTGKEVGTETPSQGAGVFKHTVPSGFLALCTANLEEPTISPNADTQADDYFNTRLYVGNGYPTTNGQTIDGVGFKSDFTWIKDRDRSGYNHYLFDSIRGATKKLMSTVSNPEGTEGTSLTSWNIDGFVLGANNEVNYENDDFVSWNWKAGGTAVLNEQGSINSNVSANTDAGFSIVSFTGNGSNDATIGHGLDTTPAMIITKNRDDSVNWRVWHKDLPSNYVLFLASTLGEIVPAGHSNGYIKTVGDTTYSVYQANIDTNGVNGSGDAMIAYCFAEIEGYSKFGSYTGNGSTDGTFVYTGFRPAFVLGKSISSTGDDWFIFDSERDPHNVIGLDLNPNSTANEPTTPGTYVDFVSNGFKFRATSGLVNDGTTFIYMAFAEAPFKYANAR